MDVLCQFLPEHLLSLYLYVLRGIMTGGNKALDVNPPNADYNLSRAGSNWLWTVFSLFGLSLIAIAGWTFAVGSYSFGLVGRFR